jgi:hypothetical protein
MNALLTLENVTHTPIGEGDAGIIIKADGSFQVFNTFKDYDPNNPTPEQLEVGQKLTAIAVALKFKPVMDLLKQMANDPEIVGETVDKSRVN